MTSASPDPASFRDPDSRVFIKDERVFRAFSPRGAEEYAAFEKTELPKRFAGRGQIVESRRLEKEESGDFRDSLPGCALVLEHPRIPFLAHPTDSEPRLREASGESAW